MLYSYLKMALVNAWILYSAQHDKVLSHTEFLEKILEEVVSIFEADIDEEIDENNFPCSLNGTSFCN